MPLDKPSNYDANDFVQEYGTAALAELLHQSKAPAMHYKVLSAADVVNMPPLRWLSYVAYCLPKV